MKEQFDFQGDTHLTESTKNGVKVGSYVQGTQSGSHIWQMRYVSKICFINSLPRTLHYRENWTNIQRCMFNMITIFDKILIIMK